MLLKKCLYHTHHKMIATAPGIMTSHKNMQKQEKKVGFCFMCTSLFLLDGKIFPRSPQQTFLGPCCPELDVCPCPRCKGECKGENVGIFSFWNRRKVPPSRKKGVGNGTINTIWSSNHTPGHISRENHNLKRHMHPNVHSSTIYNSQDMETT